MRDPARIDRILQLLRRTWKEYPDMRFGQLFEFVRSQYKGKADTFYIEDDEWEGLLRELQGGTSAQGR